MKKSLIQSDIEAWQALRNRQIEGLNFFFDRYYSSLTFYAVAITNDFEQSRDIASIAFVKLWQNTDSMNEWKKVKHWLYIVVHNEAINYVRDEKKKRKHLKQYKMSFEHPEAVQEEVINTNQFIEVETYRRIYEMLQLLTPRSREVFQKFYFQSKSLKQIALEMAVSVNTVKTLKLRAIKLLKEKKATLQSIAILFSIVFDGCL